MSMFSQSQVDKWVNELLPAISPGSEKATKASEAKDHAKMIERIFEARYCSRTHTTAASLVKRDIEQALYYQVTDYPRAIY